MKASELQEKSVSELAELGESLRKELFKLRMAHAMNTLATPSRLRDVRKDIARVETILHQRTLQASA